MKRMSLDKKETTIRLKNLLPEGLINEGTRSQVGIINRNGKIASTYVHYDGYPRNMKPGIKKHLKNEKDVLQLIKRGGARGIYNVKDIEYYDDSKMKPTKGDFKDIAKFYKLYLKTMRFWQKEFPNNIYNLSYESLIENPKDQIEKILVFSNLKWDENVMNHYKNPRIIRTLSFDQANKPISKKIANTILNYKDMIGDLIKEF